MPPLSSHFKATTMQNLLPTINPLEKRIKRRIIGRTHEFFAQTAPGIEHLCLTELKGPLLGIEDARIDKGGVVFSGKVLDCYRTNLHLRTANRILMRVIQVQAGNFRQLARKLKEIPWELYLPTSLLPAVSVSTRGCRLHHTNAIADCFQESIDGLVEESVAADPSAQDQSMQANVFIRGAADVFTVSVDSSGPLLYKRGIKRHGGPAPLRETLAAAVLMLAGYNGRQCLLDPMCGSGTFAIEAAMMALGIPAGWFRSFAFMNWPCFRAKQWQSIRKHAAPVFGANQGPRIWSSDKDQRICRTLAESLSTTAMAGSIQIVCRDFFDWQPAEISTCLKIGKDREGEPGLVVLNPPYGRRLGGEDESKKLLSAIVQKLATDFSGWRFALISPHRNLPRNIRLPHTPYQLFHGGLKLALLVGQVP